MFVNEIAVSAFSFRCRSNYRLSSVYFILFVSFFLCFGILFACLRFGSHFRSHDSHVTGEHMVELGGHFCCCFFARANSSSTYTYTVYLKKHLWCKYRKQYSGNKIL